MTTGRLFPLPSSPNVLSHLFPNESPLVLVVLGCLVLSLNSLNGEGLEGPQKASEFQRLVLQGLREDCVRVSAWTFESLPPSWEDFFRVKGVDYKLNEVLTAQVMREECMSCPAIRSRECST